MIHKISYCPQSHPFSRFPLTLSDPSYIRYKIKDIRFVFSIINIFINSILFVADWLFPPYYYFSLFSLCCLQIMIKISVNDCKCWCMNDLHVVDWESVSHKEDTIYEYIYYTKKSLKIIIVFFTLNNLLSFLDKKLLSK
jgi:hypothetical protein